jgi:hypothetical protein
MYTHVLSISQEPSLYTNRTDWDAFRETLDERLNLAIPLQTSLDIEDSRNPNRRHPTSGVESHDPLKGTTNPIWLASNSKTKTTQKNGKPE